ncbi:MAG TPA: PAS domain-containing sensor histidine kinase [Actinomycetes bacterium]|jgi:PAS domain S-box-containing protein|nr:PAS domain-containing sensor histidine kinase [Actinomycetes bacterium]
MRPPPSPGRPSATKATEPALPAGRRTALPRPALLLVWASALVGLAVLVAFLPGLVSEIARRDWRALWPALLFTAALVTLAQFAVNVPVRNHRFSVNVADMVIVLGVVFVRTPLLVVATAVGIAISQCLVQPQVVKRLFNVSQHVLSVAAAAVVSSTLIALLTRWRPFGVVVHEGSGADFDPILTLVWVLAMAAFFVVNHSMVAAVVSLSTGEGFGRCWRRAAPVTAAGWAASTSYGLVIAALLTHDRALLLPLLVVPIGLSFVGNRAWTRGLEQGQRMHSLYAAGRALSNRLGDTDVWHEFVAHVAGVLNCEGAAVFLGRPEDGALDVISTGGRHDRLAVAPAASAWEQAAKGYITRSHWPRSAMVMMEADGRVLGYAVAFGPRVEADFTSDDRGTLLTLANQGAAALLNESLYREAESERAALRDIVGHSTDGIYTVGPDRTVRSWNPAMMALTGYGEEEAVGQKCFNLLRARDTEGVDMCAADCPILAAARSGREEVRDASVLNKDGVARWIHYAHAPIMGSDGDMDADVVVVRDVTRERQTDELKADFVASVSHELRTPLTPIKGFLMTLLREDRDFTQDRRHEYYKLMLMQAQRLERLIEDLLEVTRLETGAGLVDSSAIDAIDLVRQVVERFTSEDPARVVTVIAPNHAVYCRGDWMRTDQVLANLLSNALRYSPPNEPVEVRLVPQGREVVFEVRDSGPGIPIDEQPRIFERFHRGGHYLTREQGGAGLGLYLAKRLVEAMGGRIWVSSRLGHGSAFSFALPAEPSLHVVPPPRERHIG